MNRANMRELVMLTMTVRNPCENDVRPLIFVSIINSACVIRMATHGITISHDKTYGWTSRLAPAIISGSPTITSVLPAYIEPMRNNTAAGQTTRNSARSG
jgi:hypothetical protein